MSTNDLPEDHEKETPPNGGVGKKTTSTDPKVIQVFVILFLTFFILAALGVCVGCIVGGAYCLKLSTQRREKIKRFNQKVGNWESEVRAAFEGSISTTDFSVNGEQMTSSCINQATHENYGSSFDTKVQINPFEPACLQSSLDIGSGQFDEDAASITVEISRMEPMGGEESMQLTMKPFILYKTRKSKMKYCTAEGGVWRQPAVSIATSLNCYFFRVLYAVCLSIDASSKEFSSHYPDGLGCYHEGEHNAGFYRLTQTPEVPFSHSILVEVRDRDDPEVFMMRSLLDEHTLSLGASSYEYIALGIMLIIFGAFWVPVVCILCCVLSCCWGCVCLFGLGFGKLDGKKVTPIDEDDGEDGEADEAKKNSLGAHSYGGEKDLKQQEDIVEELLKMEDVDESDIYK